MSKTDTVKNVWKRNMDAVTVFGPQTSFNGILRFQNTLKIQGNFKGSIDATGALIVDKGAVIEVDHLYVTSLIVYGTVMGSVHAKDKVDMYPGARVQGDVEAAHLRIADEVLFEGQCSMSSIEEDIEIFSRPTEEIKAELQRFMS